MGRTGQLVSASRFADLTGVTRERLRTWERRHGFPVPERVGSGPRRYALADVPRVIAIRRAAEEGVPLADAVERARAAEAPEVSDATCAGFLERTPRFAALISGPVELRFEYLNAAARDAPGRPRLGQALAEYVPSVEGSELEEELRAQLTGDSGAVEVEHEGWPGIEHARFALFRLPTGADERPLVALVSVMAERERAVRQALSALRAEHERIRTRAERQSRWMATVARLSDEFRHAGERALLRATADTLVRQLGAVDATIAPYMTGEMVVSRSSRRLLGPDMVTVAAYPDLGAVIREGEPDWLEPGTAAAFGTPDGLHVLAVPVLAGGEALGLVLIVFDEREELDADVRQALTAISAGVGYALLRDRFVESVREPGEAAGGPV